MARPLKNHARGALKITLSSKGILELRTIVLSRGLWLLLRSACCGVEAQPTKTCSKGFYAQKISAVNLNKFIHAKQLFKNTRFIIITGLS